MKPASRAPFFACLYHGLCDVARSRGYALTIHGTVTTDLDLVAIPWTAEAVSAEDLKDALMKHLGACGYADLLRKGSILTEEQVQQVLAQQGTAEDTKKPHGRRAWNLYMDFGAKVDLSVMPRIAAGGLMLGEIGHTLPLPLCRWWLRTRECELGVQVPTADAMPACIEFYVPWWGWPLEWLHRLIFGRARLARK